MNMNMNDSNSNSYCDSSSSSNHRIRRRRASTGGYFGGIKSSSPSSSSSSSSLGSPVSVRDTSEFNSRGNGNYCKSNGNGNGKATTSMSFDEAFKNGTIIPYFLDSAAKSFDFADTIADNFADIAWCSGSVGVAVTNTSDIILPSQSRQEQDYQQQHQHPQHQHPQQCQSVEDHVLLPWEIDEDDNDIIDHDISSYDFFITPYDGDVDGDDATAPTPNSFSSQLPFRRILPWSPLQQTRQQRRQQQQQHYEYNYENEWRGHRPLAPWTLSMNEDSSSSNNPPPPPSNKAARSTSGGTTKSASNSSSSLTKPQQDNNNPNIKKQSSTKSSSSTGSVQELERVHVQHPGADRSALKELPALRDAPPAKREELFILKLKLCSVIFSFDDPMADKRGKDMKRQTLLELVDYVNTPAGQKIFTESVMGDLMAMVSANVCRALPPATDDFDPEEDEPVLEPAWPHLQVAYEFFLRFIVSSEVNAKAAKKYVDQKFCLQLVELFDSEDPRERDYLKTILHRIYGKFMSHRSFIRRAISNVFYRFVYETERHNGIGELLEILGSIINGFAIPLKKEHLQFLVRALIPLHKPKCVALYHQQLSYCIIQYVEKDADTATPVLNGFFKCWPWSSSGKQVMFLNELEEILELLGADQLAQVSDMLFTNLARCLDSDHFQVVERALFLWNNEHLVNSGCLSRLNAQAVLPIIYGPLYKNSSGHWNATVEGLAQNVLKMYMEYDLVLYDRCTASYFRHEEEAKLKLKALEDRWSAIENVASTNVPSICVK